MDCRTLPESANPVTRTSPCCDIGHSAGMYFYAQSCKSHIFCNRAHVTLGSPVTLSSSGDGVGVELLHKLLDEKK